ncbi:MAG TPA: HEAT repeat domain-containing protein [Verrucomicrobiae bacterium]
MLALLGVWLPVASAAEPTEAELIAQLSSSSQDKVAGAMQKIEKLYPLSPTAIAAVKKYLPDDRIKVKRKAARVVGSVHAEVSAAEIAAICTLLKNPDPDAVIDGLKALRGLTAASAVPEILPLLNNPTPNVVRDACRTLAVLGNKGTIPSIEPLLKSPNPKIQKDALDAIAALKAKS